MVTIETGMGYKYQATIIEGVRVDLLPSETQNSTIFTAPTTVESNINSIQHKFVLKQINEMDNYTVVYFMFSIMHKRFKKTFALSCIF